MKVYKTLDEMVEAIKRNELPQHIVSPGAAAAALDVTRQTIHDFCRRGTLPCWRAERVILIDGGAVQARCLKSRGVPEGQWDMYATK